MPAHQSVPDAEAKRLADMAAVEAQAEHDRQQAEKAAAAKATHDRLDAADATLSGRITALAAQVSDLASAAAGKASAATVQALSDLVAPVVAWYARRPTTGTLTFTMPATALGGTAGPFTIPLDRTLPDANYVPHVQLRNPPAALLGTATPVVTGWTTSSVTFTVRTSAVLAVAQTGVVAVAQATPRPT